MANRVAQKVGLVTGCSSGTEELFRLKLLTRPGFRWQMRIKRVIDVIGSLTLILMLAPLMLVSAGLVGCTSRGGVFFTQRRWGLREREFVCYKLRSMYSGPQKLVEAASEGKLVPGVLVKLKNDPRVTPVGRVIRKWSIDELPQLFNVLMGDMSLAGPRPLVVHMMTPYPEIRSWRCLVKPGITGLWQLRNREKNTSVLDMVNDDREYIENFSLALDLRILLATLPAVLRGTGAH